MFDRMEVFGVHAPALFYEAGPFHQKMVWTEVFAKHWIVAFPKYAD